MCRMSRGPPMLNGLRVIDCAQLQVVEAPPGCQYVALSYVWGKQNTEAMHQGFETRDNMLRTIRDAVKVPSKCRWSWGISICGSIVM